RLRRLLKLNDARTAEEMRNRLEFLEQLDLTDTGKATKTIFGCLNPEAVSGRQYVNEYVLIITRLSLRSRRHNRKVKYEKQSNLPAWIHAGGNHDRGGHHRNAGQHCDSQLHKVSR